MLLKKERLQRRELAAINVLSLETEDKKVKPREVVRVRQYSAPKQQNFTITVIDSEVGPMAPSRTEEIMKKKRAVSEKEKQQLIELQETKQQYLELSKKIDKTIAHAKSTGENSARSLREVE